MVSFIMPLLSDKLLPRIKERFHESLPPRRLLVFVSMHSRDDVEEVDTTIGFEGRGKVEARLRQLEGGSGSVL